MTAWPFWRGERRTLWIGPFAGLGLSQEGPGGLQVALPALEGWRQDFAAAAVTAAWDRDAHTSKSFSRGEDRLLLGAGALQACGCL